MTEILSYSGITIFIVWILSKIGYWRAELKRRRDLFKETED